MPHIPRLRFSRNVHSMTMKETTFFHNIYPVSYNFDSGISFSNGGLVQEMAHIANGWDPGKFTAV